MTDLLLGVRLTPFNKMNVIKLNNVDLKETVTKLRNQAAQQINLPENSFDIIYCGCFLENDSTLESCGLKNGAMVHILKKKENEEKNTSNSRNASDQEANLAMLTSMFKSFLGDPLLELAMRRLTKRPEVIENIISTCPGLNEDSVAMAILQDPDLVVHFTDPETMKKVAKLHPALLEAAQHIASAVHEEAHSFAASSSSTEPTSGRMYSLENFSDDEEMAGDSSQSSDSTQPSYSANQSRSQINANMLASAISRAQRSTSASGNIGGPSSSFSPLNTGGSGVITFEMFNQAMQQAVASSSTATVSTNPSNSSLNSSQSSPSLASLSTPQSNTPSSNSNDLQRQISLMHEMGLRNDGVNIQALQITNGDVQAAIELVLSGFGDN